MYEQFFGLNAKPFALTPDPEFLYLSPQHARALTLLEYGLESHAAFGLLTGEIGSGKTTVVRRLTRGLDGRVTLGLISNSHAGFGSVHEWALSAFDLKVSGSKVARYDRLVHFFIDEYAKDRRSVLVVDEAQNLDFKLLEELRLLSNVNSEKDLILQIFLVGQPELRKTLAEPRLKQLAQRISVDFHLRPLTLEDTHSYVQHRLKLAGASTHIFVSGAVDLVHEKSGGVPRLINQLCDISLVYAFADARPEVDRSIIEAVFADRTGAMALPIFENDRAAS